MSPESPIIAELHPLLDALCEETITPEQLRRLEELVLAHPEAEAFYIQFMSLHADLISHVAGLPEPKPIQEAKSEPESELPAVQPEQPTAEPAPQKSVAKKSPKSREGRRYGKVIAWLLVVGVVGTIIGYPILDWRSRSRAVRDADATVQAHRAKLALVQAEEAAARQASRKDVDAALAVEAELAKQFAEARETARKAIEEKDFVVRLTGPAHIQPGAPNKWQIETLRHGAIGRPKRMDVIVKDGKDHELFRQTHDKPVGAATLELSPAFWSQVKPGTELFLEVVAYTNDDRKSVLADRLPLGRPVYVTHLVTDKPLYKPGETIRFRSLTLDRSTLLPPEHDLHLLFKLSDPANSVIPLDEGNGRLLSSLKPVLGPDNKPLRGIGVGEYTLPIDAPGGEYKLDLFEVNAETKTTVRLESRKFIVNRYVPDIFEKKLEFDGKSYGPGEYVQARIEVSRTAGGAMKNAKANVVAAIGGQPIHEQKDAVFTTITDASGIKTVLDVRFKLPADLFEKAKDAPPSATLSVNIQDGSDAEAIVRPIPLVTKTLRVEFFPEGGEMIAGVPGRVYFMVRTPIGKPADLKGTITDGTNTISEVTTLTDAENPGVNRGHGVFTLTPEPGKKYFLKLSSPIGITEPTKDGYPLPAAKADGVALMALDAVTERGGAIRVRLQSAGPKTLHVGAYVRERLIAQQKVSLEANTPVELALQGDEGAGGVARLTVFEEVRGDDPTRIALVPRAERLVFRKGGKHLILQAKPDKTRYSPSDKVRLDLSACMEKGQPTPAVLLVGVVNRSVIAMADNKQDRLQSTHFLLSGEVKNSADLEHADFLLTDHPKAAVALDLLLGTQGWRRFAEQEAAPANPADKPDVESMLVAHGQRPSAPVELFKLEAQRIAAEFAPKLEQARLRAATAEAEWNALASPVAAQLSDARVAVSIAESRKTAAEIELERFEEWFEKIRDSISWAFVLAVIVLILFFILMAGMKATADKPAGSGRPFIAAAGVVIIVGLGWLLLTNVGKNANSTFSFVGSSIRPPGGGRTLEPGVAPIVQRAEPLPPLAPPKSESSDGGSPGGRAPIVPRTDGFPDTTPWNGVGAFTEATAIPKSTTPRGVNRQSGGELQSDKARVATALRSLQTAERAKQTRSPRDWFPEEGLRGHSIARSMYANDVPVVPFVVREYAHQRDPSLSEVRSDFTETVYWHPVLVLPDNGKATVEFQLSDDIARYQVLVAGHTLDGRVGAITQTIEARKPFSVDPKLPLEISHTDTVDVPVRVTNDSDTPRTVTLAATLRGCKTNDKLQDAIALGPNAKDRKILRLNADQLDGYGTLLLQGTSGAEKDSIARTIRIVPDGFPGVGSFSDMLENGRARTRLTLPKDIVKGSLRVRLEMYPTSLADLVSGLEGLLREPYGCFEQTSTTNYPNTLILDYMNQTNQTNPQVAQRAKNLLDKGYGRLTSFECPDTPLKTKHGFEWFGGADQQHEGLTAYGLLQFKDMARVHPVDPKLIQRTQAFLMSRRDGQGGFKFNPRSLHSWVATKHIVNAYIVWALVESDPDDNEHLDLKTEIAAMKAEALNADSTGGKDPYFIALIANVMLLRNEREAANKLLDRLKEKHFKNGAVTGATTSITSSGGRDLEIETTGLALLGWLRANDPSYATTIKAATRWISQQRGGYGGFGSTQSTILALKALTLYAKKSTHPAEAGELRLVVGGKVAGKRKFTENDLEVIGLDIANPEDAFKPGETTEVEIETDAKQPYPFALSYTYTTLTPLSAEQCAVKIGTNLAKTEATEGDTVPLHVTLENKLKKGHGMAVAIIGIPAGMKVPTDMKQLTDLREKGQIAYFEIRGRELILYWRELAPEQKIALVVDLVCDVPGSYRGPASRGYLYYNADHKHWVPPLAIKIAPMAGKGMP